MMVGEGVPEEDMGRGTEGAWHLVNLANYVLIVCCGSNLVLFVSTNWLFGKPFGILWRLFVP